MKRRKGHKPEPGDDPISRLSAQADTPEVAEKLNEIYYAFTEKHPLWQRVRELSQTPLHLLQNQLRLMIKSAYSRVQQENPQDGEAGLIMLNRDNRLGLFKKMLLVKNDEKKAEIKTLAQDIDRELKSMIKQKLNIQSL